MKKTVTLLSGLLGLALVGARPAAAQITTEIGFFGTWIHSTSRTVTDSTYDIAVELRDGGGGGLFVDVRPWKIASFELSGSFTRQSAAITAGGSVLVPAGRLDATPVVLIAKFHVLGDRMFDLWVGGGESYTFFQNLHDPGLDAAGIGVVEVKGKFGLVAAGGFRVAFTPHAAFVANVKYLAVKPESQAGSGPPLDLNWNPVLVSGGFGFRF